MGTQYVQKPKVECAHCGGPATKTRPSANDVYYCSKPDCQKRRRAEYAKRLSSTATATLQSEWETKVANGARFLWEVLHRPRVECPRCGLENALPGYPHFDFENGQCLELGQTVPGVTYNHAIAVWPEHTRRFAGRS